MIVQKIVITPLDSGCRVDLWANGQKSEHCFTKATEALDFIAGPLLTTEKRNEKARGK